MKQVLVVGNCKHFEDEETGLFDSNFKKNLKKIDFEIIEVCEKNDLFWKMNHNKSIVAVFLDFRELNQGRDKLKFVIKQIRANEDYRHLPVITIIFRDDWKADLRSIRLGADDCLVFPFDDRAMIAKIKLMAELSEYRKNK